MLLAPGGVSEKHRSHSMLQHVELKVALCGSKSHPDRV